MPSFYKNFVFTLFSLCFIFTFSFAHAEPTSKAECEALSPPGVCGINRACPNAGDTKTGTCGSEDYPCCQPKPPSPPAPSTSNASFDYDPLEPIPGTEGMDTSTLKGFLEGLFLFVLWSAGIASLFMLSIGGFWYMTSAGNTSRVTEAKNIIANALWGLVIVLITWLILYVINPDLVRIDLSSLNTLEVGTGYHPQYSGDDTKPWDGTPIGGGGVVGTGNCAGYNLSGATCVLLSQDLQDFLTCVRQKVPSSVPITITSITSNGLVKSEADLEKSKLCCGKKTSPCPHGANSCHHGCKTTNKGYSYAVDFAMRAGDKNYCVIAEAAQECGAIERFGPTTTGADCGSIKNIAGHSSHFHFSAGCD